MSEPLDKLVNDFYSEIPVPSPKKPQKATIVSCLAALDTLRKTTDISSLMGKKSTGQRSSLEDIYFFIEKGASQESHRHQACRVAEAVFSSELFRSAPSQLRKKILETYKRAGGRTRTYIAQKLREPFRMFATWSRYGREEESKAQEALGDKATRLFTQVVERGAVGNKTSGEILKELEELCSKSPEELSPEGREFLQIRGSKDFFRNFLSEIKKDKAALIKWVKTLQDLLPKNLEEWAEIALKTLQMKAVRETFTKMDSDTKAEWQKRIETLFMSQAFAKAPSETKESIFELYKTIVGPRSPDLYELLSGFALAEPSQEIEVCSRLLKKEGIQDACVAMSAEARADLQKRLELLFQTNDFVKEPLTSRGTILDFYRAIGGHFSAYILGLIAPNPQQEDLEEWAKKALICLQDPEAPGACALLPQTAKTTLQSDVLRLLESHSFATASIPTKDAVLEIYRTLGGDIATYIWEKSCAQRSATISFETLSKIRGYAISSLRKAINKAIVENPSVDYVLRQWEIENKKAPQFARLFPASEEQIERYKQIIEPLLADEKARRPTALQILHEAYTPPPELLAQIMSCLSGSPEEYATILELMKPHATNEAGATIGSWWGPQLWIAWTALIIDPPIAQDRIDQLLKMFVENGLPRVPGYFQIAIANLFLETSQVQPLPQKIKSYIQSTFG